MREFCEDRAFIRAVVSLPQETFYSSGASVKASLLFLQKFTVDEQNRFNEVQIQALAERRGAHQTELDSLDTAIKQPQYKPRISIPRAARRPKPNVLRPTQARAANTKRIAARDAARSG